MRLITTMVVILFALGCGQAIDNREQSLPAEAPGEEAALSTIGNLTLSDRVLNFEQLGEKVQVLVAVTLTSGQTLSGIRDRFLDPIERKTYELSWASSNEEVATVSYDGQIETHDFGKSIVTASVEGVSAAIYIYVRSPHPPPSHTPLPGPARPPEDNAALEEPEETVLVTEQALPPGADPYIDEVIEFCPGRGGGSKSDVLPDVILGAPQGAGCSAGSLDVLSLGLGGTIVVEFTDFIIFNGEGPDFIVFENVFGSAEWAREGDPFNPTCLDQRQGWLERGRVAVSEDGINFHAFPCDLEENSPVALPGEQCAGLQQVLANSERNNINPTDPETAGGDLFDLDDLGMTTARFVRIDSYGDNNDQCHHESRGVFGFDLDAISIVHGTIPITEVPL
jgi:hypothetical protein